MNSSTTLCEPDSHTAAGAPAAATALPAPLANFHALPDDGFVRVRVVSTLFGVSIATVWNWTKNGSLPASVKLGPRITGSRSTCGARPGVRHRRTGGCASNRSWISWPT